MFTNPTRAIEATRTSEFDHPSAWSLADDIADRIAAAAPAELHDIHRDMWLDHANGKLSVDDTEVLSEAFRTRLEAIQERCEAARPCGPAHRPGNASRASARRPQRSPDRQASIERRRRMVGTIAMPPALAAKFTWGEQAALRIVGNEVRKHGVCSLPIPAIAALAGVHRTTVQNALRQARRLSLATVQERRRRGQASLTNIVRIISKEWLTWIRKGPRASLQAILGEGSNKKLSTTNTSLFLKRNGPELPPWGIPDGVYPCEEVA